MTYYDRAATLALDGSPMFATAQDEASEGEVASLLEAAWKCRLGSFGRLAPLDWYAERDGRLVGVLELKTRTHATTTYPTVYLNVRKWLALQLAAIGLGVPALFVVRFTDGIRWSRVGLDNDPAVVGGCTRIVKSRNDVEPVIEVPVASMSELPL